MTTVGKKPRFQPTTMRYDFTGRPILSANEIQAIAEEVLDFHAQECLQKPRVVPILDLLTKVGQRTKMKFGFSSLGKLGDKKIQGAISFAKFHIFLDESLCHESETSLRFVAAHELGHWIPHRYRPIDLGWSSWDDTNDSLDASNEKNLSSTRQWTEYQANTFASCLILPELPLRTELRQIQQKMGIIKRRGFIYENRSASGRAEVARQVDNLAARFQVSRTNVRIRLRKLGIIIEQPEGRFLAL